MSSTLELYRKTRAIPLVGKYVFSIGYAARAPYFLTCLPIIESMEPYRAVATMVAWPWVKNHLGTVHAIAACNLAESAMGMVMEATTPRTHRWIPIAMQSRYLGRAKGTLTATATTEFIDWDCVTARTEVPVMISITDSSGTEVVHVVITTSVSPAR